MTPARSEVTALSYGGDRLFTGLSSCAFMFVWIAPKLADDVLNEDGSAVVLCPNCDYVLDADCEGGL